LLSRPARKILVVSRFDRLARLKGMDRNRQRLALAAVVVLHLIVTVGHGFAHGKAAVPLNLPSLVFVILVIQAGPLIGLAWMWRNPLLGARLIGLTMAASLLFGLLNHFVIPSPDHVDHVVAIWRPLFETTAWLLVVTEAAGAILGLRYRSVTRRLV
jgi:hypothetical protein